MTNINKVLRLQVLRLAWPVILEMSGVMLTGAITTAMVGRLGAVELSAVGIATMVQMASAIVVSGFGTGASALVGRESGAGQWDEVRKTTGQALLLGVLLGSIVACCGFLGSRALFRMIGAEAAIADIAGRLMEILFLFTPVYLLMAIGNAVLRGLAKTRTAFYIGTFSNLVSLLLAYGVGHCSVIVLAGTFTEVVQRFLNWNEQSKGVAIVKGICGVLVLLGGVWLIYSAP